MDEQKYEIKPNVLDYDDVRRLVPKLDGHEKLVNWVLKFLSVDKVNGVHSRNCDTPGPEFVKRLLFDEFKLTLKIDNEEILNNLPEGAFVTVSNHPFGALDGIALIHLIASRRPEYKVMVNMVLNAITAMRPNFIAVDALASNDPKKKAVSMQGIRQVIKQLRSGAPVGFFPAGAVSKINWKGELNDREWQPTVTRLIQQAKVPVIPIFFHGSNSWWFNFLGKVSWQLRTLRLPAEVFRKIGTEMHISVGEPISVEEQIQHQGTIEEFGQYLKEKTYELRSRYGKK
ncbi:MAG: lysophospholipid acyltransferase family protein [Muribaculaceae bacterium]